MSAILLAALGIRLAYLHAQPAVDPTFSRPTLDGGYYLEWARGLVSGTEASDDAYYLAPLFPHLLALFVSVFGESFFLLYLVQHLLSLAGAGLIAWTVLRRAGQAAALCAAALCVLHHPLVFFASQPLAEPLALFFLALSLRLLDRVSWASAGCAGIAAGLAALARPNLLLVAAFWAIGEGLCRRWTRLALMGAGVALVILPVAVRNLAVSGHPVLISSNVGITAYHGNGPGAVGVFTLPAGFSGALRTQREEATALARARTGLELDAVEADRWWGMEALRTRLARPRATVTLLARRAMLLLDSYEHGLGSHPMVDANPWRLTLGFGQPPRIGPGGAGLGRELPAVPFGVLFGLAVAALSLRGLEGAGGARIWSAIIACALTPLLFFVSSRYRLPAAVLLAAPAGVGLSGLLGAGGPRSGRIARIRALALAAGCVLVSLSIPARALLVTEIATAQSNRAAELAHAGDLIAAEREARAAVAIDPRSAHSRYGLGVILEATGRAGDAEAAYRHALELDPGHAEAAGRMARLLVARGSPAAAVPILRRAVEARPACTGCWADLVRALALGGDPTGARRTLREAARAGVALDPRLVGSPD